MQNLLDWDQTIQVGDFVFSGYHGTQKIFKVTQIDKRFLTADDLKYIGSNIRHPWFGAQVGDEYNPIVYITLTSKLDYLTPAQSKKKVRKYSHRVDGKYLTKITPQMLQEHIYRLDSLVAEMFP